MKQYCRYCSHLFCGNGIYCEVLRKEISESKAKHTNKCESFELNPIDAFAEHEKEYTPRIAHRRKRCENQLSLNDVNEQEV